MPTFMLVQDKLQLARSFMFWHGPREHNPLLHPSIGDVAVMGFLSLSFG